MPFLTPQGIEYFEVHTARRSQATNTITPKPPARETEAPPQPRRKASSITGAALIVAIDAAQLAEQHAHKKGIALEFGPEDVRSIADTLFIAASRGPLFAERMDKVA